MTTVRIPEEPAPRPLPWGLIGWALSILLVGGVLGGVLGWLLWESRNEVAALEAEIVSLNEQHAAQVTALLDRIDSLIEQHANQVAALQEEHETELEALREQHKNRVDSLLGQIDDLNDEKEELEREKADLEMRLEVCGNNVKGLIQRADRLEAELDACLIELNQPQRVQILLPDLLRDNTTTIYVIDDSGSMVGETIKVQEALIEVREKPVVGAELSIMLFGDSFTTLFNFTDPATAPWDYTIGEIKAAHGGTDINLALQTAFDSIKDEPNVNKRIVLLTDGHGFIDAATVAEIEGAGIPVDTIAFGAFADYALLSKVAQLTGGEFAAAN